MVSVADLSSIKNVAAVSQYGSARGYDARQERFLKLRKEVIEDGARQIGENTGDTGALFYQLFNQFAARRHQLAIDEDTDKAEQFGVRYKNNMDAGYYPYTPLIGVGDDVGKRAVRDISSELHQLKHTNRQFLETARKTTEVVNGRIYSTTCEILSPEQIAEWSQDIPVQTLLQFRNEWLNSREESKSGPDVVVDNHFTSQGLYQFLNAFKTKYPDLYKQGRMHFFLKQMGMMFPSPVLNDSRTEIISGKAANFKSDWVLITTRAQLLDDSSEKPQMMATKQLLTWVYRNYQKDPCARMLEEEFRPPVFSLHQDIFLQDRSLNECSHLFKQILSLDRNSSPDLIKPKVAELRYLLAQAAPCQRGSATIGEWLEGAIYRHFGFVCSYKSTYTKDDVDMAALRAITYSGFLREYDRLVELTPIP